MRPRAIAIAAALLAGSACERAPEALPLVPVERAAFAPSLGVDLAASSRTAGGVRWRDLQAGTGAEVRAGQRVRVHYRGTLADGTLFDENEADETPLSFRLGQGEVIRGWDEGVAGMRIGGTRQLVIPPELGYGGSGRGAIPGNAILVFTVTVVGVE